MKNSESYVTGIALSQFVHGAEALGISSFEIICQLGLSQEHLLPTAQVPEAQYEMALLQLALASESDSFGVDIGLQLMPPLYGVLTSLALSSPTLGEALKNMANYQALATGNCGAIEYHFDGEWAKYTMSMSHQNPVIRRHVAECVFTFFSGLLKLMSGRNDIAADEINLEHGAYSESTRRRMEAAVGCRVNWEQEAYTLVLSRDLHDFKIHGHGDAMLRSARQLADQQLAESAQRASAIDSIKWHARELMLSGSPRRETVAGRLNISTRTLDRRLKEAGMSWQILLDGLRAQQALDYLSDQALTVAEIAEKLGFSEIRAFQRRFKKWTGMTPTGYRQQLFDSDQ